MALNEGTMMEPGSITDTANRLISWSRRPGWGLASVEYVSEFARERVLSSLRYALAEDFIPLHEIELPSYKSASEIVQFLIEQLSDLKSGVVSVSGFATAFQTETTLEDSLRVLNFNRENLIPPSLRQVWWLPSSFAETFVPAVPDLDSWFTVRLYLTEGGPSTSLSQPEDEYPRLNKLTNIPPRNRSFIGRESVLNLIRDGLKTSGSVVIYGLGGIGKSQTAFEYAYRQSKDYKTLLWTRADSEDSLVMGLFRIAVLLDLPEVQESDQTRAVDAARRWLQFNDDWLLILDEVNETRLLSSLLGNQRGHILATSRRKLHASLPNIGLPALTPLESRKLLTKRAIRPPKNQEEAKAVDELAKELGNHPLALELAGAYIAKKRISYEKYLFVYRNFFREFNPRKKEPLTVLTADLTFRDLKASAQNLLKVCSFFDTAEIPLELVLRSLEMLQKADEGVLSSSARDRKQLVRLTDRYSLMHADTFSRICTMHTVVKATIRNGMDQGEQRKWAEKAVLLVSEKFSYPDNDSTRRDGLVLTALTAAELVESWDFASREATMLLASLGLYLRNRGQHNKAEPLLRRALRLVTNLNESNEPITIGILEGLAGLYYDEGRYKEAKNLLGNALQLIERLVGSDDPTVGKSLWGLARIALSEKDYQEAESLLRRALEIQRNASNQDPEEIITTIHYLAAANLEQDRFEEAEYLFRQALEFGEHHPGLGQPALARTLKGLARLYLEEDKYDEAKPIYERLLNLVAEQNRPSQYGKLLTDLAYIYLREGSFSKAEELLQKALDIEVQTRNNWQRARILEYLSNIYYRQGRFQDAERHLREALQIREELLGPANPNVVTTWQNYSTILRQLGRGEEAKEIEQKMSRMNEQHSTKENTLGNGES